MQGASLEHRVRLLEKRRENQQKELEEKKKKISNSVVSSVASINSKFAAKKDYKEEKLKKATFGLVTHEEFIAHQESVEIGERILSFKDKEKNLKRPRKSIRKKILSFDEDNEEDDDEEEEIIMPKKKQKIGKNPFVDTSFLPDRDRDAQERAERIKLKKEWLQKQAIIKQEEITITYSYWDGCGHRRCLTIKKGTSIDKFLECVKEEFKELRTVTVENLLFVKEDLIVPHNYTFYDLIVTKARGKSGPLFSWDVHEDIRLLADATKEKDESHAAKVVERHWYERNKHIFPANRWEIYDPQKDYGSYTSKDARN